jgi:hypothetical protein
VQDHELDGEPHRAAYQPPLHRAIASGMTTVWTLPLAHIETALPELARQVFGQRDDPRGLLFVRTPQLLTRTSDDVTGMITHWLDQVTRRVAPGGLLTVETRDVRIGSVLQPLGLEVWRALRQRRGLRVKEIIVVVPAEDTRTPTPATDPLAITHRYLLVASRDRSTSTV